MARAPVAVLHGRTLRALLLLGDEAQAKAAGPAVLQTRAVRMTALFNPRGITLTPVGVVVTRHSKLRRLRRHAERAHRSVG
jgi:hypothetical protein